MNKKGFTLIEMLAVVVLLGLLMGLLFPAVSKYIIGTRDNTYTVYEADMKTSAQNLMTECVEANDTLCIPKSGKSKKITLSELIATGFTDKLRDPKDDSKDCDPFESFVMVDNEGDNTVSLKYDVCLVCGDYKSGKCDELIEKSNRIGRPTCQESDDDAPPICGATQGDSKVWANIDRTITIGCSDTCTGCVQDTFTKKFTEEGETGTITIADNSGKTKACPVDVYIDKTAPKCTLEVVGTVGEHGWYKADPRPVVKMVVDQNDTSGIATYGMGVSRSNYDFNKELEFEVQDGITTVYGYVKDNAGNVGTCNTEVQYDPVPPTIKTIDYGTIVYPKDDIATKSGSKITLNNITSEYGTIYGVYIYMASGKGGTVTVKNGNTTLSTVTVPTSTSKARNYFATAGSYNNLSFTFGSATDVNNVSRIELLTRDDTVGYYTNKNVTLYINATDSVSGRGNYKFDNNSWQELNSYTYTKKATVNMKVKDTSGNESTVVKKEITNIDKVIPGCSITLGNNNVKKHDNDYFWENVPIKLNKDDANGAPDYATSGTRNYGLKNSSGLEYNGNDTGTQTADANGHTWYGYVRDNAGNLNSCNVKVYKDTVNPSCTLTKDGTVGVEEWYRSNVTLSFSDKKDNNNSNGVQSGLAYWQINTTSGDPSSWTTQNSNTQTTDTSSTDWYGHVKDKAGHTARCKINVKRDTVSPPKCDISHSGTYGLDSWYVSNVSISMTTYSDERSGLYSYGIGGYNSKKSDTHTTDGTNLAYTGYVMDKAGNTNSCTTSTFKRDATPPECSLEKTGIYYTDGIYGKVHCTDNLAGVNTSEIGTFGGYTKSTTINRHDLAGNETPVYIPISSGKRYKTNSCTQYTGKRSSACDCETWHLTTNADLCGSYDCSYDTYEHGMKAEGAYDTFGQCEPIAQVPCGHGTQCTNCQITVHHTQYCAKSCPDYCSTYYWCRARVHGCDSWTGYTGKDHQYPDASCSSLENDTQCMSATVYY